MIFTLATEIAAVSEVHRNITSHKYVSEEEATELLKLGNPLKTLAGQWELAVAVDSRDFGEFITETVEERLEDELNVTLTDELREKYGNIPLNTACLLELVEISRRIFGIGGDNDFDLFNEDEDGEGADV